MTQILINLPNHRLSLSLTKRRGVSTYEPLFPKIKDIRRTKSGNKVSRFFRHIFEHKNIRKILGANLAVVFAASSFLSLPQHDLAADPEKIVINQTSTPLTTQVSLQYPLPKVKINQGYSIFHPAVDLDGEIGDPIKPIMPGRVEDTSSSKYGYGNAIIINHGSNLTSLYAHLSKISVNKGDEVNVDTTIGLVGSTGHSTGPHLHLEIRDHNVPLNPLSVLPKFN